jgi:transposase
MGQWALVLRSLGYLALQQDSAHEAIALFQQSLICSQDIGDKKGIAQCLEGCAYVASAIGQPEQASRLWGSAEALWEPASRQSPADRTMYHRSVAAARAQIDPAAFTRAWAEGRALSFEQAIVEATTPIRKVDQPIRKVNQPIRKVDTIAPLQPGLDAKENVAYIAGNPSISAVFEIPDALWEQIEPLLPPPQPKKKAGRPRMDDRKAMTAIYYILHTGGHWKALPSALGARSTVHDRFQEWRTAGLFERMQQAGVLTEEARNRLVSAWQTPEKR